MPSSTVSFAGIEALERLVSLELEPMMALMGQLFPICRSLTGAGVRETFDIIGKKIPIERTRVPTGTKCFDWEVPREWNIRDAYVASLEGNRLIDFKQSNLHVLGYSTPVKARIPLSELQKHLYSLPDDPDAIPYRASYYTEQWGFCVSERQRQKMQDVEYDVLIDSTLEPGFLDYAQSYVRGRSEREVLLSTYICHPSLANNELSGPVLLTALFQLLGKVDGLRYSYRGVFTPETIGTIAFLSKHFEELKRNVVAGYVVSCVGDDGPYTYVRSKRKTSLADRAAEHVLKHVAEPRPVILKDFEPIGSDERQYCSPGINLPVGSILRSRHGEYPQYHTSKDDLSFVSEAGLRGSLTAYLRTIQTIEMNYKYERTNPYCEPQLGKRGLYATVVTAAVEDWQKAIVTILNYADGEHDLIDTAEFLNCPVWHLLEPLTKLMEADLIRCPNDEWYSAPK